MTSRDFAFWLQGYFEIAGPDAPITITQSKIIQVHLALVFIHEIDPSMGDFTHQVELNAAHAKAKPTPPTSLVVTEGRVKTQPAPVITKPTLQELIPDTPVVLNWNVLKHPKPPQWNSTWEYDPLHGWFDPAQGRMRC